MKDTRQPKFGGVYVRGGERMSSDDIVITTTLICPRCGRPAIIKDVITIDNACILQEFKVVCEICDLQSVSQINYNEAINKWQHYR